MGYFLVHRLLAAGHEVTLFHRGQTPDPFGDRVTRVHGDRATADLASLLGGRDFDAAVDFTAYTEGDARGAVRALRGRVGHYVMISTGQVYLVREGYTAPATEEDYAGPLRPAPADPRDHASWVYGVGKRACEDVLAEAWEAERFPATRLRIPMVNGPRDPDRRIERYVARLLDGGPVLVPDGGAHPTRHVYAGEVVAGILAVLAAPRTAGRAYNLCQDATPSLAELLTLLAEIVGAAPRLVPVPAAEIAAAGLDPVLLSPFSGRWMSMLDPARAIAELDFRHQPLSRYLETVVTCLLAHPSPDLPPGYDRRREEIALAERALARPAAEVLS